MRTILLVLLCLVGGVARVQGQVNVPYEFVPNTPASATQVNANFDMLLDALDRTGGELTGNITVLPGVTIDGIDLSKVFGDGTNTITVERASFVSTTVPQLVVGYDATHLWESRVDLNGNVNLDLTAVGAQFYIAKPVNISGALTLQNAPGSLICTGCLTDTNLQDVNVSPGTWGSIAAVPVFNVNPDGRITSVNNVPISIPEEAIINGTLYARVGDTETITGGWHYNTAATFHAAAGVIWSNDAGAVDEKYWATYVADKRFGLITMNDTQAGGAVGLEFLRVGTTITSTTLLGSTINLTGNVVVNGTFNIAGGNPILTVGDTIVSSGYNLTLRTQPLPTGPPGELARILMTSDSQQTGNPASSWPQVAFSFDNDFASHLPLRLIPSGVETTHIWPDQDTLREIGNPGRRYKTAHFDLPSNTQPSYVVVNKGGAGADKDSALGYVVGYPNPAGTQVTKTMGACQVTMRAGLILNVTGC